MADVSRKITEANTANPFMDPKDVTHSTVKFGAEDLKEQIPEQMDVSHAGSFGSNTDPKLMTNQFEKDAPAILNNNPQNLECGQMELNTEGVPTHRIDMQRPSGADSNGRSNFINSQPDELGHTTERTAGDQYSDIAGSQKMVVQNSSQQEKSDSARPVMEIDCTGSVS